MEDIIVSSYTENLGMAGKAVIQLILDILQKRLFVPAENHLDYLVWAKRLTHLKRLGRVVTAKKIDYRKITDLCVTTVLLAHNN